MGNASVDDLVWLSPSSVTLILSRPVCCAQHRSCMLGLLFKAHIALSVHQC